MTGSVARPVGHTGKCQCRVCKTARTEWRKRRRAELDGVELTEECFVCGARFRSKRALQIHENQGNCTWK